MAMAWTQDPPFAQGPKHTQLTVKPAGGSWTTPEEVAPVANWLYALTIDGKGNVTVAYVPIDYVNPVQPAVRTRAAGGAWGTPDPFGTPGRRAAPPAPASSEAMQPAT